ncbi:MAG: hypothetical protein NTX14_00130 [Candidatus Nealsonbacteria bacterium]|nr:hypothetical protein [Candidatus Nealsonbacteria bacterium]
MDDFDLMSAIKRGCCESAKDRNARAEKEARVYRAQIRAKTTARLRFYWKKKRGAVIPGSRVILVNTILEI